MRALTDRQDLPSTLIVLDAQALGRLNERTPRQQWVEVLARSGLLERMAKAGDETEEGRLLKEIRTTLVAWGKPRPALHEKGLALLREPLFLGVLVAALVTTSLLLLWQGVSGFFCFVAAGPLLYPLSQRQVHDALPEGPSEDAARLATLVHRLLQRSFVTVVDGAIVEHIPHCALLRARLAEIDLAEAGLRARAAEIEGTRREIARVNQRMGRAVEDAETARLTDVLETERRQREALDAMRSELEATLLRTDEVLRDLRMTAIRRSLSERATRLSAGSGQAGMALAAAETELAGYSERLLALAAETEDADSRLRALLEVRRD